MAGQFFPHRGAAGAPTQLRVGFFSTSGTGKDLPKPQVTCVLQETGVRLTKNDSFMDMKTLAEIGLTSLCLIFWVVAIPVAALFEVGVKIVDRVEGGPPGHPMPARV